MRDFLARRPSPAMAVAFVALLAALSGTAVALPGTNSVDSGDIKNGQVKTKDIKNNDVRSGDVRNSTLTGGDVSNDSLTGADINEGTLGQVPSATTANSANTANTANSANTATSAGSVDGVNAAPINFQVPDGTGDTTVLNLGGLQLVAECVGGTLNVDATNVSGQTASFRSYAVTDTGVDPNEFAERNSADGNMANGASVNVVGPTANDLHGHTVFTAGGPSDSTVTIQWQADDINVPGTDGCLFSGNALQNG